MESPLGTPAIASDDRDRDRLQARQHGLLAELADEADYYADPYFSSSAVTEPIDDQKLVEFSSTVSVTDQAYSNRYTHEAGGLTHDPQ